MSAGTTSAWSLTATQLMKLWNDVFPKIVGSFWRNKYFEEVNKDPSNPYLDIDDNFWTKSDAYRKNLIKRRYRFVLPEKMNFEVDDRLIQTFFLSSAGIILPKPKQPDHDIGQDKLVKCISKHYVERYKFEHASSIWGFAQSFGKIIYEEEHNMKVNLLTLRELDCLGMRNHRRGDVRSQIKQNTWYLSSSQITKLFLNYNKYVCHVWTDDELYQKYRNPKNSPEYVRWLVDLGELSDVFEHPDSVEIDPNGDEIVFTNEKILLPVPARPANMLELYDAWASGEAGIPTFTQTS